MIEVSFDMGPMDKFFNANSSTKNMSSFEKVLDRTQAYALLKIKSELPKRSGNLRRSYLSLKTGKLQRLLESSLPAQADTLEGGRKGRTIYPKRGKFLVIPISDSVMNQSRSGMKKLGKKQFQTAVKNGDIILAKKVVQRALPGQKILENRCLLPINLFMEQEASKFFSSRGF